MAWVEHTSGQHWRVRYRRADGTVTSEGGFTTPTTAHARAQAIEVDQHRSTFYDPTRGHTTINQWLPLWWTTLTDTTLENYHYLTTTSHPASATPLSANYAPATSPPGPPTWTSSTSGPLGRRDDRM